MAFGFPRNLSNVSLWLSAGLSYQGSQKGQQTKKVAEVSNVEAVLEYDVWCLRGERAEVTINTHALYPLFLGDTFLCYLPKVT